MATNILNFFGYYRLVPEQTYTFYSYAAHAYITKQKPVAPFRTLSLLKSIYGSLTGNDPNTFNPKFY